MYFIIGVFLTLSSYMNASAHGTLIAVTHSGVGWIGEVFRFALVMVAASVIIGLQYFRRKTSTARLLLIAFGLLLLTSQFLPWRPAFAIEERLSSKPGAGAETAVTFDEVRGKFKSPSGLVASSENTQRRGGEDNAEVFLPLQVAGVRNDAILLTDRVEVHVIGQDGRVIYHGTGDSFEVARLPEDCIPDADIPQCEGSTCASSCRLFTDSIRTHQILLPASAGWLSADAFVGLVQDENERSRNCGRASLHATGKGAHMWECVS
jgi:hypothetical protein